MITEKRIDEHKNNNDDQFPVGMRVLAVDDDPTCLMLLENLLRKCQYHVTTTRQAITALKMLRENKNKFDLVISDVHMPDMDGFKLLELVGLEMDLPVIMLSANGDNKLVMKGITHGACDYLLKPVRIEELKNIWQHVIRRKKFDPKDKKDFGKPQGESGEGEGSMGMGDYDPNTKLNRKRKDQNDDEDEDRDENGNEDPSTQKKPRVVWSVDLHRKFVAAVNHLGIDKAVPTRILDLMNVEKLSREDVASHLQKYRLYLKRISSIASQQANMTAALGSADSAYMRMATFNGGFVNLQTMAGSGQFQNAAYGSLSPSSVLNRLNTPSGIIMNTLSSPRRVQLGQPQNSSNPILQGMPMSAEFDQMQHNLSATQIGDLPATTNDTMGSIVYPISSCFLGTKINGGSSSNSILGGLNNPISLQNGQRRIISQNQPSVTVNANPDFSSHLPDFERCNDNWPSALQPSEEFNRLCSSLRAKREHASLLEDFREFDRARLDLEEAGGGSYEQAALLKERAGIGRSTGQMDTVISQVQETLGTLVFQRSTFGGINSKLSNVSSRLPTVNSILSALKKKKSMDTISFSLVASVCTFLMLIYWLSK